MKQSVDIWTLWVWLLFGDVLQLALLLVLLGELCQASQGRVYLLDGQEALGSRRKGFTLLEEHPHRLRHVALEEQDRRDKYLLHFTLFSLASLSRENDFGLRQIKSSQVIG